MSGLLQQDRLTARWSALADRVTQLESRIEGYDRLAEEQRGRRRFWQINAEKEARKLRIALDAARQQLSEARRELDAFLDHNHPRSAAERFIRGDIDL